MTRANSSATSRIGKTHRRFSDIMNKDHSIHLSSQRRNALSPRPAALSSGEGVRGGGPAATEEGADIATKDDDGGTALHWAAINGHEAVARLLKARARARLLAPRRHFKDRSVTRHSRGSFR